MLEVSSVCGVQESVNGDLCLGNPIEGCQKSLVDVIFYGPSPKLLEYLTAASSLETVILCGLSDAGTTWSCFLTRHLYDPRLFLHIWAFVEDLSAEQASSSLQ